MIQLLGACSAPKELQSLGEALHCCKEVKTLNGDYLKRVSLTVPLSINTGSCLR